MIDTVRGFCEVQVHALCGCTKSVIVLHCNAKSLRAALHGADVFFYILPLGGKRHSATLLTSTSDMVCPVGTGSCQC
jgi:hypothetical protein